MKYLAFYAVMVATAHSVPGVAWLTAAAVIVVGCGDPRSPGCFLAPPAVRWRRA